MDEGTTPAGGVRHNAAYALAAQMSGAALTAILTIFLGAKLSAHEYGLFAFAMNVGLIATLLADVGVSASAGRYLAEHRDDRAGARSVFATALELKLVVGGISAIALFGLAPLIASAFGGDDATWPLRGVAIALFGQSTLLMLFGALDALAQIRFRLVIATVESAVETLSSIVLVLLGAGATGAAFGRALGYTAGLAVGMLVLSRVIGGLRHPRGAERRVSRRAILVYAGPLLIVDVAFRVFGSVDVLLVAAFLGTGAQVAAFELPMRLVVFLDYVPAALAAAVAPRMAARAGEERDIGLFARTMRHLILLQFAIVAPLLVWPEAIFHLLFGDKYPDAPAVLRALIPYVILSAVAQLATLGVNYLGEAGRRVPYAVAMLAVNVAIDAILIPSLGVVAAGIGTSAAYVIWVPAHLWILRRQVGLELAPLLRTTLKAIVATAPPCLVLLALGTGAVPLWRMLIGGLLLLPVYAGGLILLRELTPAELAPLVARVRTRVRPVS